MPELVIVAKTRDAEIATALSNEKALIRFEYIKKVAGAADAERDRLRDYIRDNIKAGQHGRAILAFEDTSPRVYPNAAGNHVCEDSLIFDPYEVEKPLTTGHQYKIVDAKGHVMARGILVDNGTLYQKKGSVVIKIAIAPAEE